MFQATLQQIGQSIGIVQPAASRRVRPRAAEKPAAVPLDQAADIFVVEDDPLVRETVVETLRRLGLHAEAFGDLADLQQRVEVALPRVLVLDLSLGRTDAIDVMRVVERHGFKGHLVLISGHDEHMLNQVQKIGIKHGFRMLPFIRKPMHARDLERAMKEAGLPIGGAPLLCDVREALDKDWLELWYQPKINLSTLRLSGAEALIRLRHPEHGVVSPASFIPSPDSEAFRRMTAFVVERAARDWMDLNAEKVGTRIAINAAMTSLHDPEFLPLLREAAPRDPAWPGLVVEVTEDDVVRNIDFAFEMAVQMKLHGIDLAIDDFGAGYSSLARLRELPFSEIKLDRSFVHGCASDPKLEALCRAGVSLARSFETSVVAEGIETSADLKALIRMGCDMGQGYLFAKPMPVEQFRDVLKRRVRAA